MIDLRPIFQPSFWFDVTPHALSPGFSRAFFAVFALFVIAGSAGRIVARTKLRDKYERIIAMRAANMTFAFGLLGFVIYFFTFEEIQFFGARFWFLIWLVALVIMIVRLVKYATKEVPLLRQRDMSRVESNKYLPRRNDR